MTFIHPYLLGGLLLAGIPVLLHLIMRQKPRKLTFPAFRFLKQKQRINQRKLRLQHLLLLALRVIVIAALCLALARPRVFSQRFSMSERPVSAVLIFDTSASMGYLVGGQSRLDEARKRARELLQEMGTDSRVAILDSGDPDKPLLRPKSEAEGRIEGLRIRPGSFALNGALEDTFRLLQEEAGGENAPPRLLYVFSDRTRASWEQKVARATLPEGVQAVFVDVGAEAPRDQAIDKVEVVPQVVAPGRRFEVRVTVRATNAEHVNSVSCQVGDELPERRDVQLTKDAPQEMVVFERTAPTPPADAREDVPIPIAVKLGAADALAFNNARHATLVVRRPRKSLAIIDDPPANFTWRRTIVAARRFSCEVKNAEEAEKLRPEELAEHKLICLFHVKRLPDGHWKKLADYVRAGGGLAVVPGGSEMTAADVAAFNKQATAGLLPASLGKLRDTPDDKPAYWGEFRSDNPVTEPFARWARSGDYDFTRPEWRPFARRYWEVEPVKPGAQTFANYVDGANRPALVARELGKGRVLQFTTPLDTRLMQEDGPYWTNYWQDDSSFGVVLIDLASLYLGGESALPDWLRFECGRVPTVPLPATARGPFTLRGPELVEAEAQLEAPKDGARLAVLQARAPGNYLVLDAKDRSVVGFSLVVPARESDLDRVPAEEIESVLGPGAILRVERAIGLREALQATRPPPVELLPLLMMALVLVLAFEGLLANKFYRRSGAPPPAEAQGAAP